MKNFQEKTNADNKSIGFDYQYYYFLYLLLGLEEKESIGIEVKDDIHIELENEEQILLQLKHSIQTSISGSKINITERDIDLWKTIYNWINIINDKNDGRDQKYEQLKFIDKTKFILVSNKSSNSTNKFLLNIKKFKLGKETVTNFKKYLENLHDNTSDTNIKNYINLMCKQNKEWLSKFLNKIEFELDKDDLINKIKSRIKGKQVKECKIEDVFYAIDSNVRKEIYFSTKSRKKTIISFEEFYRKYHIYFDQGRSDKLPIRKKAIEFKESVETQVFIRQLIDIYAIKADNLDEMLNLTSFMLQFNNHLSMWLNEGYLVQEQINDFNSDCIIKWKNTFDKVYRDILLDLEFGDNEPSEKEIIRQALKCLDDIRKKELKLDENDLDTELSNGQFYLLSNVLKIGWRLNWEERYRNANK